MALVKCSECGQEMSDRALSCPHCGNVNQFIYCPDCDKKISRKAKACPHCGCVISADSITTGDKGENYNLSIAALICAFLFPIVGLILGIMVLNSNKGKSNTAKTFGLVATIVGGIAVFFSFFIIIMMLSAL